MPLTPNVHIDQTSYSTGTQIFKCNKSMCSKLQIKQNLQPQQHFWVDSKETMNKEVHPVHPMRHPVPPGQRRQVN